MAFIARGFAVCVLVLVLGCGSDASDDGGSGIGTNAFFVRCSGAGTSLTVCTTGALGESACRSSANDDCGSEAQYVQLITGCACPDDGTPECTAPEWFTWE